MTAPSPQLAPFSLAPKLPIPPRRPALVSRSRLMEALNGAVTAPLTLVAAPPGFGKTTIVAEWARARGGVAWVSLDAEDNDVVRFWSYVFQALDQIAPGMGREPLGLLQRLQSGAAEGALTLLINGVAARPEPIVLVLDDYHLIDSAEIHRALLFLIEHLPENLRVVLATRSDPPIPLMRLRVRGQLAELRAADLRFTVDEVAEFLNGVMNLSLSSDEVAALEARSEGWIAGLQLAALSLQGRQDVHAFIESFAGSNRFIVDYLTEEILQRQPQEVRSFLLDTSILDKLSGPLCDAVTLRQDSEEMLTRLERGNLFIIPLDEDRQWYRYHRLFADALRSRLQREDPERGLVLHERAGRWYEGQKLAAEAVEHALASEVYEWAADLIERATATIWQRGELETLLRWLRALPSDILRTRPRLILIEAWSEFLADHFDAVERYLRQVEELIAAGDTTPHMAAVVAAIRASLGSMREDDPSETIAWAEQALGALPQDYRTWRSVAGIALGLAYDSLSLPGPAADALHQAVEIAVEARDDSIAALAIWNWARVCQIGGEMTAPLIRCRTLLAEMEQRSPVSSINLGYIRASIGRLLLQRNEVDEASGMLRQAVADIEPGGLPRPLLDCYVRLARIEMTRGDASAAEMWLGRSDDLMRRSGLAPDEAARRELLEETGLVAEDWRSLGAFFVDGNRGCGMTHIFLARGARQVSAPTLEASEIMEQQRLALDEVRAAWLGGQFKNLGTLGAVGLALAVLESNP